MGPLQGQPDLPDQVLPDTAGHRAQTDLLDIAGPPLPVREAEVQDQFALVVLVVVLPEGALDLQGDHRLVVQVQEEATN